MHLMLINLVTLHWFIYSASLCFSKLKTFSQHLRGVGLTVFSLNFSKGYLLLCVLITNKFWLSPTVLFCLSTKVLLGSNFYRRCLIIFTIWNTVVRQCCTTTLDTLQCHPLIAFVLIYSVSLNEYLGRC